MIVLAVYLLLWTVLLEGVVHGLTGDVRFLRVIRTGLSWLNALVILVTAACFLWVEVEVFTLLLALLSAYRVFNMMRVKKQRMHEEYLSFHTGRTSMAFITLQIFTLLAWWMWEQWHSTGHGTWGVLAGLQLLVAVVSWLSLQRNVRKTAWPTSVTNYSDRELPTVTVAIPARNETEDLKQCLQTVTASDYPKLEIIVLDDCSQGPRTPEIIRDFAQDGVRFVQGGPADETWLPKNWAYNRLAEEATGDIILFCGVDVRFAKDSLRGVVSTMLDRRKAMFSVMPRRSAEALIDNNWAIIQAVRYAWELVPPRRLFHRPPVLSTCWAVRKDALHKLGSFNAVRRSITPEAFFARELARQNAYSFLRANAALGIESVKAGSDQFETAVRMRYPQLHRRPEQVAVVALLELGFLFGPWAVFVTGFFVSIGWAAQLAAALAAVVLLGVYARTALKTRVHRPGLVLLSQPFAILCDIAIMHYSMWKYEFSIVVWKGRNICIPAMHVVPHLPKL